MFFYISLSKCNNQKNLRMSDSYSCRFDKPTSSDRVSLAGSAVWKQTSESSKFSRKDFVLKMSQ